MLSIIVAVDENNLIGNNNQLPWHLPADLKYFKSITMSKPIIMGRKTFDSIGKPLPGRKNIIISRNENYKADGCAVYNNINEAIKTCEGDAACFVIGGAELFRIALPLADKIYLTKIHHQFEGDIFFPPIENRKWKLTSADHHLKDEKNKYDYSFFIYTRLK